MILLGYFREGKRVFIAVLTEFTGGYILALAADKPNTTVFLTQQDRMVTISE